MNRAEALEVLGSKVQRERLEGARSLAVLAMPEDVPRLKQALGSESIPWIRSALEVALARASARPRLPSHQLAMPPLVGDEALATEVYARATEELTDRFVHEFRPLLGLARLHAQDEIPEFDNSETAAVLRQMQDLLRAIDTLGRAASAPKLQECDLAALTRETVAGCVDEVSASGNDVAPPGLDGPEPLEVVSDPDLLTLAIRNGVKNALEASIDSVEPIVVSWGQSATSYWVAVLDRGHGLQSDVPPLFSVGTTTKPTHLGMGLAIVQQVVATLAGTVALEADTDGHTRFELTFERVDRP